MAHNDETTKDMVTPDMIVAHQRLRELRGEAGERGRYRHLREGGLAQRIRALLGMSG